MIAIEYRFMIRINDFGYWVLEISMSGFNINKKTAEDSKRICGILIIPFVTLVILFLIIRPSFSWPRYSSYEKLQHHFRNIDSIWFPEESDWNLSTESTYVVSMEEKLLYTRFSNANGYIISSKKNFLENTKACIISVTCIYEAYESNKKIGDISATDDYLRLEVFTNGYKYSLVISNVNALNSDIAKAWLNTQAQLIISNR